MPTLLVDTCSTRLPPLWISPDTCQLSCASPASDSLQTEPESKTLSYVLGLLEDTVLSRDVSQQELQITSTLEPCPLFQAPFPPFPYTFCRLPLKAHLSQLQTRDVSPLPISLSPWLGTPECRVLKTTPIYMGVSALKVCGKSGWWVTLSEITAACRADLTAGGRQTQVVWLSTS